MITATSIDLGDNGGWPVREYTCECGAKYVSRSGRASCCDPCRRARVCVDCGERPVVSRGRCGRCYQQRRRNLGRIPALTIRGR
jgi:hypothetical protein